MIVERITKSGPFKITEEISAYYVPHSGRAKSVNSTTDQFAQLLSEGLTVREAAHRLGFSYDYGNAMLQRIRRKLGAQAI